MALNALEIERIGKAAIDHNRKNKPVDQINVERPLLDELLKNPKDLVGGKDFIVSQLYIGNGGNGQYWSGNSRVTYNTRAPDEQVKFRYTNFHDGFTLNEDELFRAGIKVNDDKGKSTSSPSEVVALANYMETRMKALNEGAKDFMHAAVWLDGTQSVDAVPGIDAFVSLAPTVGTIGALSAVTNTYWRNAARTGLAPTLAALTDAMEQSKRDIMRTKGRIGKIYAGSAFIDALRNAVLAANQTQITYGGGTQIGIDMATKQMKFDGVPIEWVPEFDSSFGTAPAIPFSKRCYMLDLRYLNLARDPDDFMKMRYPGKPIDQYAYYYAMTAKFGMEITGRNKQAVIAIA